MDERFSDDALKTAFIWLTSGRREEAEALADEALADNRSNGRAWHLKGLCAFGDDRLDAALAALDEAVDLGAVSASLLLHRAWILRRAGRQEQAAEVLTEAVATYPDEIELLVALGVQRHMVGDCEGALAPYRHALTLSDQRVDIACNLSLSLLDLGRAEEAEAVLRPVATGLARPATGRLLATALYHQGRGLEALAELEACLEEAPNVPALHHDRAVVLIALDRPIEAAEAAQTALDIGQGDPARAEWFATLGNALRDKGAIGPAIDAYRQAVDEDDGHAVAHFNLGTTLLDSGDATAAEPSLRRAAALLPELSQPHNNLGRSLREQGLLEEAEQCFRTAMACDPDDADPAYNLSLLLLTQDRFEEGLALYERRWELRDTPSHQREAPQWDGREDPDLTLLIHAEQGFGDTLQSVRFVAAAAARVGRVLLDVPSPLVGLLRSSLTGAIPRLAAITARGDSVAPHDVQVSMMSLPLALGPDELGAGLPYLQAEPSLVEAWRARLPRRVAGRRRLGLVWAGNQSNRAGLHRSLDLSTLAPLADSPGIEWVSLQVGFRSAELAGGTFPEGTLDLSGDLEDFADTAACLTLLDGLVTIDTAVAHLAGALNCPAWVLLPFVADWRWGLDQARSIRYPSLRLFRQSVSGDWSSAVRALAAAVSD